MRKRRKGDMGMANTAMQLVSGGIGLGVGSQAIGQVGGATAADAQKALGNVAAFYPMMGTLAGAGATMKALKQVRYKRRR